MISNLEYVEKLRKSGLRPTKQRINICEVLFSSDKTFHFTINYLKTLLQEKTDQKISQATVYNTINALTKKGHLKEISIDFIFFPGRGFFILILPISLSSMSISSCVLSLKK